MTGARVRLDTRARVDDAGPLPLRRSTDRLLFVALAVAVALALAGATWTLVHVPGAPTLAALFAPGALLFALLLSDGS